MRNKMRFPKILEQYGLISSLILINKFLVNDFCVEIQDIITWNIPIQLERSSKHRN